MFVAVLDQQQRSSGNPVTGAVYDGDTIAGDNIEPLIGTAVAIVRITLFVAST